MYSKSSKIVPTLFSANMESLALTPQLETFGFCLFICAVAWIVVYVTACPRTWSTTDDKITEVYRSLLNIAVVQLLAWDAIEVLEFVLALMTASSRDGGASFQDDGKMPIPVAIVKARSDGFEHIWFAALFSWTFPTQNRCSRLWANPSLKTFPCSFAKLSACPRRRQKGTIAMTMTNKLTNNLTKNLFAFSRVELEV